MEHNDVRHKLSEYIDGSITARERAEIEDHLKTCQQCNDALNELRKTVEHIKTVEEVDPPAWMTQKIMARVRAETEKKRSIFQRLFYPLTVKLPLQAVAVLFLAVTAFYIYQGTHPAAKYAETPMPANREFAVKKEVPPAAEKREQNKADGSLLRSTPVPQTPGYKALDMKQEYEAPAPPQLQDRFAASAPVPAKPAEQPVPAKKEMMMEKRAAGTAGMQEQGAPSSGTAPRKKAKQEAPAQAEKAKIASAADAGACLSYGPTVVAAAGIISKKEFAGRPNYESIANGDERETYWVLQLDKAACVRGDKENTLNGPEAGITGIQLVLGPAQYDKYRPLLNRQVTVTGVLFHAHTGHHHTPVLMEVSDISPRGK